MAQRKYWNILEKGVKVAPFFLLELIMQLIIIGLLDKLGV
jgi:hypothetical protein